MESLFKKRSDHRVAFFFAEGLEEVEALAANDILFRAGIPTDLVAVGADRVVQSAHDVYVHCDRSMLDDDFDFDDYDMLYLPGGIPGAHNLRANKKLTDALLHFAEAGRGKGAEGKQIAAICAAPYILAELGLLEGRRATANPGFQDILVKHGAELLADEPVVEDDNIITSQGMATAVDMGLALVRRLLDEESVEAVKKGIVVMH